MAANDYVNCDLNALPFETILESLFTTDATGCIGIRTVLGTDAGISAVNCENAAQMNFESLVRSSIELTPNGPAIRLLQ